MVTTKEMMVVMLVMIVMMTTTCTCHGGCDDDCTAGNEEDGDDDDNEHSENLRLGSTRRYQLFFCLSHDYGNGRCTKKEHRTNDTLDVTSRV